MILDLLGAKLVRIVKELASIWEFWKAINFPCLIFSHLITISHSIADLWLQSRWTSCHMLVTWSSLGAGPFRINYTFTTRTTKWTVTVRPRPSGYVPLISKQLKLLDTFLLHQHTNSRYIVQCFSFNNHIYDHFSGNFLHYIDVVQESVHYNADTVRIMKLRDAQGHIALLAQDQIHNSN